MNHIVQIGHPVLRQKARVLSVEEILSDEIQQLIQSVKEIMRAAPGVGLAAPQIGEPLQLAVIEDRSEYTQGVSQEQLAQRDRSPVPFHVIINPKLTITTSEQATFYEGCLSMKGFVALVPRARSITVTCLNEQAKPITIQAQGWYARILQHEIGHLQGELYIDHMTARSLSTLENYEKYGVRLF